MRGGWLSDGGGRVVSAPRSVQIASVLLFITGGFGLLLGLLVLVVASVSALFALVAILLLAIGGMQVYTGPQLRELVPWTRSAAILLAAGGAVVQLLSIGSIGRSPVATVLDLGLSLGVIYLMYRADSRAAFPRSRRPLGI